MSKYSIVGIIDFIMGTPSVILTLIMGLFTMPKLTTLYSGSGIDVMPILLRTYIFLAIILLLGITNLFFGYKLLSGTLETKGKYFKFGVISALITFGLSGVLIGFVVLSVLLPIYRLTTSF